MRLKYNGLSTGSGGSEARVTLAVALATGDTAVTFSGPLTYNGGTAVPTVSGGDYIPMAILNANGVLREIVYLTAYTTGLSVGTITRAQEGTSARAHAIGAKVVHTPTTIDPALPLSIDNLSDFNTVFGTSYVGHDQEFNETNSTSLPAGWSWFNQGTSTYLERFGAGTIIGQGSAFRGIVQAIAGAPTVFDLYVKISASPAAAAMEWGPFLTDGTALRIFNRAHSSVGASEYDQARLATWSNATTFGSVTSDTAVRMGRGPAYLHVKRNSATSFNFEVSTDGRAWSPIYAGNPSITPTHIGLVANGGQMACEWWRMR